MTTVPQPTVDLSSDLQVERSDGGSYSVTVIYSLNQDGLPEAELKIGDRMTKVAADLGFVTVRLVAVARSQDFVSRSTQIVRVSYLVPSAGNIAALSADEFLEATKSRKSNSPTFTHATEIRFNALPINGIVATSSDEIFWDALPRLSSKSLAADQQFGYFIDSDGSVVVLTKTTGAFGIRQKRPTLNIERWADQVTPGSATRLQFAGEIGEDPVKVIVGDSGSVCQISNVGVLSAVGSGLCYVTAVQGGGSMYMSSVTETQVTEVSLLGQLQGAIVEYRTSVSMLILVILLSLFLIWQLIQTVLQIRLALRTDPSAL